MGSKDKKIKISMTDFEEKKKINYQLYKGKKTPKKKFPKVY